MDQAIILGLDAGLANFGYAELILLSEFKLALGKIGVFKTDKSHKKLNIHSADDLVQRINQLHNNLYELIYDQKKGPAIICLESFSNLRHSSHNAKYGMSYAVAISLARLQRIPVIQLPSMEIKRRITGDRKASKQDMISAMETKFHKNLWNKDKKGKVLKTVVEHQADALSAACACLDSELVNMLRRTL